MIQGGVTAAKGFSAASTEAEIKYKNRTDMAMVFSEGNLWFIKGRKLESLNIKEKMTK